MMKWDFPDESSDCHVISDELVFEVKFVSKVCSEQKSRLCLRNLYLHKKYLICCLLIDFIVAICQTFYSII